MGVQASVSLSACGPPAQLFYVNRAAASKLWLAVRLPRLVAWRRKLLAYGGVTRQDFFGVFRSVVTLVLLLLLLGALALFAVRGRRSSTAPWRPPPAPLSNRGTAPKPAWARREVIRLKSLLPDDGCHKIADRYNRLHEGGGQRVGKSCVADVIRDHQLEILDLRRRRKRPPRRIPRNLIWAMDLTFLPRPKARPPSPG
ncbi:MAG: hypothetical protein SF066_19905 [Thermoanaerobaculia bacterium]|nr:hypothetical protein [Thermoanaerobaculia bacterium]